MNYFIFNTGGDWDSTTLYNNGEEFMANQLFIQLNTYRDMDGRPMRGGIGNGGEITAYVQPQDDNAGQYAIFPGKIDLECPTHKLTLENTSPMFAFEFTRVVLDNVDISDQVVDVEVNIDAINNEVSGYVTVYKPHFLGADEIATYNLL
ncbi:MAG TPA: hypothetical protein VG944_13360 [Fimbriimonas sp.]|nr:hypothetical protein [Fimbriimonas sp.]